MKTHLLEALIDKKNSGIKSFAVLIDPDKVESEAYCIHLINLSREKKVDFFFIGGSLITSNNLKQIIRLIKAHSNLPAILFPGSNMHIDSSADAILFLSLISGRNPDLLIGQHVVAAPLLKKSSLEIWPTGYILIDSGNQTTVSYMSNTMPIPHDKESIATCTAMAGEMLGLKLIYMDAGSGAKCPISAKMIASVRKAIHAPLIIGGGINTVDKAAIALKAGADVIVIGNGIEKNPNLLIEVSDKINAFNNTLNVH